MKLLETMRSLHQAEEIWREMSPMSRFELINKLPFVPGVKQRTNACIRYIADNLPEFTPE